MKAGAKEAISSAIEIGKSVSGIFTGKFESVNQAHNAIKNGGIIDTLSNVLDFALNKTMKANVIPTEVGQLIKKGKNVILDTINSNIENNFNNQLNSIEKLSKYTSNWNEYYKDKNFDEMEREYQKIKETVKNIIPLENTIKDVRKIENLHLLIKNKGKNFSLSEEEIELANKLL